MFRGSGCFPNDTWLPECGPARNTSCWCNLSQPQSFTFGKAAISDLQLTQKEMGMNLLYARQDSQDTFGRAVDRWEYYSGQSYRSPLTRRQKQVS